MELGFTDDKIDGSIESQRYPWDIASPISRLRKNTIITILLLKRVGVACVYRWR